MLGIKFHHLRALIHRPYLCLPWLTRNNSSIDGILKTQSHRIVNSERICVSEAQKTAHMLHYVADKKDLVEDFPWWQMISCLTCASSILLVMRLFSSPSVTGDESHIENLEEDANTCLQVLDALSTNSDAARAARDMVQGLRQAKVPDPAFDPNTMPATSSTIPTSTAIETSSYPFLPRPSISTINQVGQSPMVQESLGPGHEAGPSWSWNWQDWPSEVVDSLNWSSRFLQRLDSNDFPPICGY